MPTLLLIAKIANVMSINTVEVERTLGTLRWLLSLLVTTNCRCPGYMRESDRRMQLSVQTSAMVMGVRAYYHEHDAILPPHVKFPASMQLRELVLADSSVLLDGECNLKANPFEHVRCFAPLGEHTRRAVLESFDNTDELLAPIDDDDAASFEAFDGEIDQYTDELQAVHEDEQNTDLPAEDWSQIITIIDLVEYVRIRLSFF
jgi:hypothetical protein